VNAKVMRVAAGVGMAVCAAAALTIAGSASSVRTATSAQDAHGAQAKRSRAKTVFAGTLPGLEGQHLTATLLEVTYPPGGANPAHRHPCPVIGYVLDGAVRMQVKGQEEKIYRAGDTFSETPGDVHAVSANASQDQPARFLAYFVCDRETPLSIPIEGGRANEH
jgi:quercetin dioxygenase-like cupin family protein